ncbi:MAG: 4Fe-4S binding protein [Oscillospiraceae bacterium]|nr:4Fe-4S binding protein [Oscillospiraceae bacterium]
MEPLRIDESEIYIVPNPTGPTEAVTIDEDICVGCNACANICRTQTIMPNPVAGKAPVVVFPDECWYCACCVEACRTGALQMHLPINQRIFFKRKATGEIFRLGQADAPEKTFFKEPYGWLGEEERA